MSKTAKEVQKEVDDFIESIKDNSVNKITAEEFRNSFLIFHVSLHITNSPPNSSKT